MKTDLKTIPKLPGVYLMRDTSNNIVYIGKAKNLYSRIKSYFSSIYDMRLVSLMFGNIRSIDYIVCGSEQEALVLEQKLIRNIQPKYNIIWRDDKSFPCIEIDLTDPFPRLKFVRSKDIKEKDKNKLYFGPYPNVRQMKNVIRWISKFFKIRLCKYDSKIFLNSNYKHRFLSCIYLQTNSCYAPCLGKVDQKDYLETIKNVILFLKGRYKKLVSVLKKQLDIYVKQQNFENAIIVRDVIKYIESMFSKFIFREISENEILQTTVENVELLKKLKDKLELNSIPLIIEAIDVSNLYGTNPTGSLVRFVNGLPDKSSYRRYKIKYLPTQKPDDYSMIKEVVIRRYARLLNEKKELPNLLIIDGGKGHLNIVKDCLKQLNIDTKIDVIALAKEEDKIYKENKSLVLKNSPEDNILRYIRDEAHRFAISYHKFLRKKNLFLPETN